MAKSGFEIRMDYKNAIRQADSLTEVARELRRTADNDLQYCVAEISNNWTGDNSTAYVNKCNMLKSNILKTADRLEKTAVTIRKIAKNTYDAEMKALQLATVRKY